MYILANRVNGALYVGVTRSLERRMWQHKTGANEGYSKRYGLNRLVYCEDFRDVTNAIARETQLKGWRRSRKISLIRKQNPGWEDLSATWF